MAYDLLKGIVIPIVSPCDESDELDLKSLEDNFFRLLKSGADGMYICGGTGDGGRMSADERRKITAMMVPVLKKEGKASIVHVGETYQREAVGLAVHAAETGADAVASIPPRAGWSEVEDYYKALAGARLPVIVYYIPAVTGMTASLDDLRRILEIDGVCGIKMSDWNIFLLGQVKQCYPDKIVYSGYDELLLFGLLSGADGSIGTWANLLAPMYSKMYSLVKSGRCGDAVKLQSLFSDFLRAAWKYGVIDAFEELMYAKGYAQRCFRRPGTWNQGKISHGDMEKLFLLITRIDELTASL